MTNKNGIKFGLMGGSALLLSPFAKILSGFLLAALLANGAFSIFKILENKNLEIKLLETEQNAKHFEVELKKCQNELDTQNIEIDKINVDSQRDIDIIDKTNRDLINKNIIQEREINRLKNLPAPKSCEESKQWLVNNLNIFEEQ
jgi:hypothetical protein